VKISAFPLIPIARQEVSRTSRLTSPVEIARLSGSVRDAAVGDAAVGDNVQVYKPSHPISEHKQQLQTQRHESQQKAIEAYRMTAAIEGSTGDGDLIGVDVFA